MGKTIRRAFYFLALMFISAQTFEAAPTISLVCFFSGIGAFAWFFYTFIDWQLQRIGE